MADTSMLWPAFAMAGLTLAVWLRMYVERIGQMKRLRVHPQKVASQRDMLAQLPDTRAADNFRNLFELPVLFYLALVVATLTGQTGPVSLTLAWAFVALRALHSLIHCSYNRVMHRFAAYAAGGAVLWLLWGWLAWGLLK
ncbi:MAPEG family protein [Arenimonas fontis]|uniref:MAPEG family protein n=1 Tax=Arenimonas fontis TaxID=2608255 RepID=A0A5B2Z8C3_9GAMM|nr:MAPEG family protein [Arenimonas fontis]KAA2284436.1 hypothetical protein F0415_08915 [Arenimonas fontis]